MPPWHILRERSLHFGGLHWLSCFLELPSPTAAFEHILAGKEVAKNLCPSNIHVVLDSPYFSLTCYLILLFAMKHLFSIKMLSGHGEVIRV